MRYFAAAGPRLHSPHVPVAALQPDLQAPPTHPPSQLTPELPSTLCAAGHVTNCTGGCWHPTDRTTALTCSEDGTLRVWDVMEVTQKTVIKPQVGIYIVNTAARARVMRLKNLNVERRPGSPLEGLQGQLWKGRRGRELRFMVQVSHFSRLCHVNRHRNSHPQPLSGAAQQANGSSLITPSHTTLSKPCARTRCLPSVAAAGQAGAGFSHELRVLGRWAADRGRAARRHDTAVGRAWCVPNALALACLPTPCPFFW